MVDGNITWRSSDKQQSCSIGYTGRKDLFMVDMVWFQSSGNFKSVGIPIETVNKCIDKYNNEPDNFRMKQDRGILPWSFIPYLNWELFWTTGVDYHLFHWDYNDNDILQQLHPFRIREV